MTGMTVKLILKVKLVLPQSQVIQRQVIIEVEVLQKKLEIHQENKYSKKSLTMQKKLRLIQRSGH